MQTGLPDRLLELASHSSPLLGQLLQRYGDAPLESLLSALPTAAVEPLQRRDDLWSAVHRQAEAYYGTTVAELTVAELRSNPLVPTSNHFGVDTFADSVQGTLLFALRQSGADRRRIVVVFGFTSISMNNLTYPMGLQLYDPRHGELDQLPQRLPIFPNRVKRCTVGAAGPFDSDMVSRARARLSRMAASGEVTRFCEQAADDLLATEFAESGTLEQRSYGRQATRVNAGVWRRLFAGPDEAPQLVQLPIEPVCAQLLATDLTEPDSLLHRLVLDPEVRTQLVTRLDGARACWRSDSLAERLTGPRSGVGGNGTVLFWGLSEDGRRVPLAVVGTGREARLAGVDDQGRGHEWPLTADELAGALRERRLLPALFTCFATLAFARGLACVGGYYQHDYLPVMQRAVVETLWAAGAEARRMADRVAAVPTDLCLAGVQGIVRVLPSGAVLPAGPVEIVGSGGLTGSDIDQLRQVPVRDACRVAITELFDDLAPQANPPPSWMSRLADDNGRLNRLVRLEPVEPKGTGRY